MLRLSGRLLSLGTCLAVLLSAPAVRSAEIDRHLPDDTEVVLTLNVRQLLDSPLVKKHGVKALKDFIDSNDEVKTVLQDLGYDPLRDLDRISAASPGGGENDKGLMIIHGKFDRAKFNAKGEEVVKSYGDILKIHKIADAQGGQVPLYEVAPSELPFPIFVALASDKTLLISPGKDYVVDAVKRQGKPALKSKEFQALLEKMDPRQSFSVAALGSALTKGELPERVKEVLQKLDAIGGGLTISEDINLELVGNAKTEQAAKDITQTLNDGLTQGLGLLSLLATQNKALAPAVEIAKTIKCLARDKTVIIKGALPAEVIEKWSKKE